MSTRPPRNEIIERDEPITIHPITDRSAFFCYGNEHPRRVVELLEAAYDLDTHVQNGTLHIEHAEHINPGAVEDCLLDAHPEGSIELTEREPERPSLGKTFESLPARERAIHGRELRETGCLEVAIVGWDPVHSEEEDCWRLVCRLPWNEYIFTRTRDEHCLRRRQVDLVPEDDGEWTALESGVTKPFSVRVMEWLAG